MRNSGAWILGLIFLAVFVYIGWNGFELPKVILGETNITTGKIVNTYHKWGVRGGGSYQRVKFVYSVNDSVYFNFKTVGKKYGKQNIGNRVKIKYSLKNPDKSKVEAFYNDYQNSNEEKFHTNENIGLSEISLINGLYTFIKYGERGKIIFENRGEYKIQNDSLILQSFDKKTKNYFQVVGSGKDQYLTDYETKMILKK
ncbi:hypothetical protein [Draconibacterium sediminis]|uniref:hypothetical protein n=1 Tax=Draconibacterium sediminis TaxID=1544798 RepID=UPI0026EE3841|nr:hypothetical protein [Draconibacterium sediminis]